MHRILAYRSDRQMQKTVCQFIGHFPGHQFLLKTAAKPVLLHLHNRFENHTTTGC